MASGQDRSELDARARHGESARLLFWVALLARRSKGGKTSKERTALERRVAGDRELGRQTRKEQLGSEGHKEIGSRRGTYGKRVDWD
ncbi:hypothetical protein LguiA_026407 [Lonicera macranthoides]